MGFFDAISVVRKTTSELTPPTGPFLPSSFGIAISLLQKIRYVWSLYHYGNIYSNQDNFWHLTSGHLLNVFLGNSRCIQTAALCVLIARRISNCVQKQSKLQHSYEKLCWFCRGDYPKIQKVSFDSSLHSSNIKQLSFFFFKHTYKKFQSQLVEFLNLTFQVACKLFALSMAIADTADCFSFSPTVKREAVNFFFLNGSQLIEETAQNTKELLNCLQSYQATIDKMLIGVQSPFRACQIIQALTSMIEASQTVNTKIAQAQSVFQAPPAAIKNKISDFVYAFGLSDFLPESLQKNHFERTTMNSFKLYGQYVDNGSLKRLQVISKPLIYRTPRTAAEVFKEISQKNTVMTSDKY